MVFNTAQFWLQSLQRRWRLIAICVLLAWVISLGISLTVTPRYRATATFLVFPNPNLPSSRDIVTSLDTLDKRTITTTYANIMSSDRVFQDSVQQLGLDPNSASQYVASAHVQSTSNIFSLSIEGPDPHTAAALANAAGANGTTYTSGLYQVFEVAFLDLAVPPTQPYSPQPLRDGLAAASTALAVSSLVVIVRARFRTPLDALRRLANIDSASSAFNQRYFKSAVQQTVARNPSEPLSLGLIKFEGLEGVLDMLPVPTQSQLLHAITNTLRNQLRGNDIVGRLDKTIFALLMPATPQPAAERTMARLQKALGEQLTLEATGEKLDLLPAAGLGIWHAGETADEMLRHTQSALEHALSSETRLAVHRENERDA